MLLDAVHSHVRTCGEVGLQILGVHETAPSPTAADGKSPLPTHKRHAASGWTTRELTLRVAAICAAIQRPAFSYERWTDGT